MSRRILVAVLMGGAALMFAMPAVARTSAAHRGSRPLLRMDGHAVGLIHRDRPAVTPLAVGPATVTVTGFKCQVTVGSGTTDRIYTSPFVFDSLQFYVSYKARGKTFFSVTTNCIGSLPAGTVVAPGIVTAKLAACHQFNPLGQSEPNIVGVGITTTFPDGTFTETCNTPKFHP
jgi:hypothetical protein